MWVYAGIDESGYGPLLGPLVIVRSAFVIPDGEPGCAPPSLWTLLKAAVCKGKKDKRQRIAVNDSKHLYSSGFGLSRIERGVLPFLYSAGVRVHTFGHFLKELAFDERSWQIEQEWYRPYEGEPPLPLSIHPDELDRVNVRLQRALTHTGIQHADIRVAVVFEDRFNELVRQTHSKLACAWSFVSGHLSSLWDQFSSYHPVVVVDRQGGRKNYHELLCSVFPFARVTEVQTPLLSSGYQVKQETCSMKVIFQVKSEKKHLPVALASMTAKYTRELLMKRFQQFWKTNAPGVRPTFGYYGDGRRFLQEIDSILAKMDIDRDKIVRCC